MWRKPKGARLTAWAIVVAGCLVAIIALVVALAGSKPTLIELAVLAPESVAIAVTAYLVGLRPIMEASYQGIVVRNVLQTSNVPWPEVSKVAPEQIGLVVYTPNRRLPVSAVPDAGRKVDGRGRSEVVAEELAHLVAMWTGTSADAVLGQRPVLSAAERRNQRIVFTVTTATIGIWVWLLMVSVFSSPG